MINFDTLPNDKPLSNAKPGTYFAKIEKAEMKAPKDPTKNAYLSITFALTTKDGKSAGKLFDILTESDHALVQYKLKRFILALELPLTGAFELADLTKVVQGKELIVDITEDKKSEQPRMVVDVFKDRIYYPLSEANEVFDMVEVGHQQDVINASDADDYIDSNDEDVEY